MFKIVTRDWSSYNGSTDGYIITCCIDIHTRDSFLLFHEDFSVTHSIMNLIQSVFRGLSKEDSLFICTCGVEGCGWFKYELTHLNELSTIKCGNLCFEVPFKEYALEVLEFSKKYLSFIERNKENIRDFKEYDNIHFKVLPFIHRLEKVVFGYKIDKNLANLQDFILRSEPYEIVEAIKLKELDSDKIKDLFFDKNEVVRCKIIETIGLLRDFSYLDRIIEKVDDSSEKVVFMTVKVLGLLDTSEVLPPLRKIFLQSKNNWLITQIGRSILRQGDKGINFFEEFIQSGNEELIEKIFNIISTEIFDHKEYIKLVIPVIKMNNISDKILEKALYLLWYSDDPGILNVMYNFVKEKTYSKESRLKAIGFLFPESGTRGITGAEMEIPNLLLKANLENELRKEIIKRCRRYGFSNEIIDCLINLSTNKNEPVFIKETSIGCLQKIAEYNSSSILKDFLDRVKTGVVH